MNKNKNYIIGLLLITLLVYNIDTKVSNYEDLVLNEYNTKYFLFLVLTFSSIFFTSIRFLLILKKQKINISLINSFKLSLNQFAYNILLFSGAGEIDKFFQKKHIKISTDRMLLSIAMERFFGLAASLFLLIISLYFFLYLSNNTTLFFILTTLIIIIIFFFNKFNILKKIYMLPYFGYFDFVIRKFFKRNKNLLSIFFLSIAIQFSSIIMYYFFFSFYFKIELFYFFLLVPFLNFLLSVPFFIAGIGVRDLFFSIAFFYIGINYIDIIPITLLIGFFLLKTAIAILFLKLLMNYLKFSFMKLFDRRAVKKIQ